LIARRRRGVAQATRAAGLATLVAVLTAGCSDSPTEVVFQVIEETTFAASLGIDLADFTELPDGVWIREDVVGAGDAFEAGGDATVNYTGWLADGTEFDSGDGYAFPQVIGGLVYRPIPGFELGLDGTQIGGTRMLIIPPELAYGARGARDPSTDAVVIPPGAIVIFEVELVSLTN
jgi:FKBP-type peptidyl-prolyl cis-trans isomerase